MRSTSFGSSHKEILGAALQLAHLNFPLVPTCAPTGIGTQCTAPWHEEQCQTCGKRPLVRGFPARATTPPTAHAVATEMQRWWHCNIALVTGNGLIVVEADTIAGEEEVLQMAASAVLCTPTRERRPGRGRGWIFSVPPTLRVPNCSHRGVSGAIDVRGAAGIFVLPPSTHYTGHVYSWVSGLEPWNVRPAPAPDQLVAMALERAATSPLHPPARSVEGVSAAVAPHVSSHVRFLRAADRKISQLWVGDGKLSGDQSRSGIDHALARALLLRRVPAAEVVGALLSRPNSHRQTPEYALRTVTAATASIRRSR